MHYWGEIADRHGLDLTVVNPLVDPTWRFMTLDWDGKIRMDCSSPSAMASLVAQKDAYDVATGNDADADRHGIVTPDAGLMNPNHYLAVAIEYLFGAQRCAEPPGWPATAQIGKTLVSSLDDRPGRRRASASRWSRCRSASSGSCPGCSTARSASAARSRPARRSCATTAGVDDRQGRPDPVPARRRDHRAHRASPPASTTPNSSPQHGDPAYARIDAPADREQKAALAALSPEAVTATELAGEPITAKLTAAPGNGAAIGGLKVTTESAWFAARPSGTEDVYKIYAESFRGAEHLAQVQAEARDVVSAALRST